MPEQKGVERECVRSVRNGVGCIDSPMPVLDFSRLRLPHGLCYLCPRFLSGGCVQSGNGRTYGGLLRWPKDH